MLRRRRFPGSARYWEERYVRGGTSGAGSYGQLARFKADVLNELARSHHTSSVIELGCGDGNQLSLAEFPRYLGLDVSPTAVDVCIRRFADDPTKSFIVYDPRHFRDPAGFLVADLALSLDVLYHLVEDEVFEAHLHQLFDAARRLVVIYAYDCDAPYRTPHVRYRRFTDWVVRNRPEWRLAQQIPNKYKGDLDTLSDFYVFEPSASPARSESAT